MNAPTCVEACVDRREQRAVALGQLAGLRNLAEVAVGVRQRAIDEVAPVREQLVVVAADELGPREVGVLRLGSGGDEVEAQRVGVVALEEVADVDRIAATGRELLALHRQELAGDDVGRKVERAAAGPVLAALAVPDEHRRPDHRVEDDVVLALEVVVLGVGVLPPLAPGIRLAPDRRPLDRRREVADHRVEPDVDALVLVLAVAVDRDADAPVEVARDRPGAELIEQAEREVLDVRAPLGLRLDPGLGAARRTAVDRGRGDSSRGTREPCRRPWTAG